LRGPVVPAIAHEAAEGPPEAGRKALAKA
jgi:hypothetical protein